MKVGSSIGRHRLWKLIIQRQGNGSQFRFCHSTLTVNLSINRVVRHRQQLANQALASMNHSHEVDALLLVPTPEIRGIPRRWAFSHVSPQGLRQREPTNRVAPRGFAGSHAESPATAIIRLQFGHGFEVWREAAAAELVHGLLCPQSGQRRK